jgi:hypothetical protein
VDVVVDVLPVEHQARCRVRRATQRGVKHRPAFRDVDPLSGEHRAATLLEPDLAAELDEGSEDVVGQEVLRQVDVQVGALERKPLRPCGISGKPGTKVRLQCGRRAGQSAPGRGRRRVYRRSHVDHLPGWVRLSPQPYCGQVCRASG